MCEARRKVRERNIKVAREEVDKELRGQLIKILLDYGMLKPCHFLAKFLLRDFFKEMFSTSSPSEQIIETYTLS